MVDFVVALKTVSAGLSVLKELNQIERDLDKATLKLKIGELATALSAAQLALADAQTDAQAMAAEIESLKANFRVLDDELVEERGYYYRKRTDGGPRGHPYCSVCLSDGVLIMLSFIKGGGYDDHQCPKCKSKIVAPKFNWEE